MRIYNRPFDERKNDFQKMWSFLINDYKNKKDKFIWTIGRLGDWKYGIWSEKKYFPSFMRKNAQLWLNNFDEIVGFVISEDCNNNFTIFAGRGYEFLYNEMIVWLKINWSNRGELATEVHEYQESYMKALEQEGFRQKELCAVTRQYDLADKAKDNKIPDSGFKIEDMANNYDLNGKALLYINAWGNRTADTLTQYDLLRYEYNRESPCFNPKFDLSVVSKDGIHVAACVAFIDYENNYAEIEKVCTHSDYRRRGFAEAVIRECFKRLYAEGIEHAYITGYSTIAKNLYGKLGEVKTKNWFEYALIKESSDEK